MSEIVENYERICDKIKNIDPSIRFAGVINERGKLVAGGMKSGLQALENEKDDQIMFMELALRVKMRKEFDKQLGLVNFAMASREKEMEISFPLDKDILFVSTEPDADYSNIIKKILKIIE